MELAAVSTAAQTSMTKLVHRPRERPDLLLVAGARSGNSVAQPPGKRLDIQRRLQPREMWQCRISVTAA